MAIQLCVSVFLERGRTHAFLQILKEGLTQQHFGGCRKKTLKLDSAISKIRKGGRQKDYINWHDCLLMAIEKCFDFNIN